MAIRHLFRSGIPDLYLTAPLSGINTKLSSKSGRCLVFLNIGSVMGLGRCLIGGDSGGDTLSIVIIRGFWNYLAMVINKLVSITKIFPNATGSLLPKSREWHIYGLTPGAAIQVDGEAKNLNTNRISIIAGKALPFVDLR